MFEDGFYTREEADKPGRLRQYFKFPWLNSADVIAPPAWVGDTVWYQIMPDRFCRGNQGQKRFTLRKWDDHKHIHFWDTYGGDLPGIINKLEYLRDLGITGIYMLPLFESNSNHKYNTFDYTKIDSDFGTEEDLVELVEKAHSLGIRVMVDAVFNHSGTEFAPWKDVVEKGPESAYWDWFFVGKWPLPKIPGKTEDGRFYSFAFTSLMPKLNTNNPEVISYFREICEGWVRKWNIDGIRFDVGNEVSHYFLKELNRSLKAIKPDLFLLGEIWHDSVQWLQGDEYDSVMNFPFLESVQNFWLDNQTSRDLMYSMNRCYSMYPEQVSNILFNFVDNHDTMRAVTRCGDKDIFYQQLTMLMTMPGSACIYYGTEIALEGGNDPDCRRPMPWSRIEEGKCDRALKEMRALIALRKTCPQTRTGKIIWRHSDTNPRLVCYGRYIEGENTMVTVYLNAGQDPVKMGRNGELLYSRKLRGKTLMSGGIAVYLQDLSE
jgi:glycosidase